MESVERAEVVRRIGELEWQDETALRDAAVHSLRTCVGLVRDEGPPARPAATKIGGEPELPADWAWPGEGLVFVAQLDLAEYARHDDRRLLSASGMLYFFAAEDEGSNDWLEPKDVRVLYWPGGHAPLVAKANPEASSLDSGAALEERGCSLRACYEVDHAALREHDIAFELGELMNEINGGEDAYGPCSRVLPAHSRPPDGDEDDDDDSGIVRRTLRTIARALRRAFARGHRHVLLQLQGSDLERAGDTHSIFGENTLYFCIAPSDLARRRFDRVRLWVGGGT